MTKKKALLFDADVIFHFISGDKLLDLFNILPNDCLILDKVYVEVTKHPPTKRTIDNQIRIGYLKKIDFPTNPVIIKEYAHLRSPLMNKGEGESACMAYCKHTKDVIASSNLKDIGRYCKFHSIDYLTTMDFIALAYSKGMWDIDTCDSFISTVLSMKHKLPYDNFTDYCKAEGISLSA